FAFVDLDLFDENVKRIAERAGSKKLRIASKSIRCVALTRRVLAANPIIQGIMCYTGYEAIHLARNGFDDLLVAYPIWHEAQVGAVCDEIKKGKRITLMLDSREHVRHLAAVARKHDTILPLCLDIDMSSDFPGLHFGIRRSPITKAAQALEVYAEI